METKMAIELATIKDLIPYARNARIHSDVQVSQIAASIKEFGWTNPILIDSDKGIIAGHGRLLAARKLGLTEVPVISLEGLTDTQKRAYILADNRIATNAGWDIEMLGLELDELNEDIDLTLAGFTTAEIDGILAGGGGEDLEEADPQAYPENVREKITIKVDSTFVQEITDLVERYCKEHAISMELR
tara:strand:+ start:152 stop:715 length:564 start_codon:yes stop_codon:yes gene_type:complete